MLPAAGDLLGSDFAALPLEGEQLLQLAEVERPAERATPASVLGKRRGGAGNSTALQASYRGVSLHHRTGRNEAHIWIHGKQLYLGGFYSELTAAVAYDLAAVFLRGQEAVTNLPLPEYSQELSQRDQVELSALVELLRRQAKSLARLDATTGSLQATCMEPWEIELSECLAGRHCSLGVFGSEQDAARAVDAALLARDGLAAAPCLNFPLVDYLALLDASQIEEALRTGLLPLTVPAAYRPADLPQPLLQLRSAAEYASEPAYCCPGNSLTMQQQQAVADSQLAPPVPAPVPRKASVTPRYTAAVAAAGDTPFADSSFFLD